MNSNATTPRDLGSARGRAQEFQAPRKPPSTSSPELLYTAKDIAASVPGRSLAWIYEHMRLAGGAHGLVRALDWERHLNTLFTPSTAVQPVPITRLPRSAKRQRAPHDSSPPRVRVAGPPRTKPVNTAGPNDALPTVRPVFPRGRR